MTELTPEPSFSFQRHDNVPSGKRTKKRTLIVARDNQRSGVSGTEVVSHPSAQSKLSREHLAKRLTQKP